MKNTLNERLAQLGILSDFQTETRVYLVGVILTQFSLYEIREAVDANSDGWNGDIGKGARILSKVLFQL